jgi:hypothetical protein
MVGLAVLASGCAARRFVPPTDPGTPLGDLTPVQSQVFKACSGVNNLQGELSLSGRAGDERVGGGTVLAGFERPDSMRLEGLPPFGGPVFILVTRGGAATLLLPREDRVVRGARPEEILGRLTGVALAPADLLAILTGCVVPSPRVTAGRLHGNGVASLDLDGGATIYLRRPGSVWLPVAARRDGWLIEYPIMSGAFPGAVRLRSDAGQVAVDVTARLANLEANTGLPPEAFEVQVPPTALPATVDELRDLRPLRGER